MRSNSSIAHPITRDRLPKLATLHLGKAEVDQAGPILLHFPRARRSAATAKRVGGFVGSAGVAMRVSDDAERRGEAAGIVPLREDALRGERVLKRRVVCTQ